MSGPDESLQRPYTDAELMRQGADVLAAERRQRALISVVALLLGAILAGSGALLLWSAGAGIGVFGIMVFIMGILIGLDS